MLPAPVLDDVLLLVTELVANAVRHGGSPVTLTLSSGAARVRVEVADGSPAPPQRAWRGSEADSGRGLQIVDYLASRWGTAPDASRGKTVWAELDVARGVGGTTAG